jgi:hypothetical protein
VAQTLGIGQNAVSQLENRTDLYLSTLGKYVSALGLQLELALVTAEGQRVPIPNFRPWDQDDSVPVTQAQLARKKTTARASTKAAKAGAAATPTRKRTRS